MMRGQQIKILIPHDMMQAKGMPSRYLVGTFLLQANSGKAFKALVRPGRRKAPKDDQRCLKCKHPLERDDSRAVGYGPDCARKLGVRWPRKDELSDAELADVSRQLDQLQATELWFPFWESVVVTTTDGTPIPHPARPDSPPVAVRVQTARPTIPAVEWALEKRAAQTASGAPVAPGRLQLPERRPEPTGRAYSAIAGHPSRQPVGEPVDAIDMLHRMLDAFRQKMPGYEPRLQQVEAMEMMVNALTGADEYPDFIAEIKTGGGKSLILVLAHLAATYLTNRPMILATATKALQAQYMRDIPRWMEILRDVRPFKATVVKGRSNYLCLKLFHDRLEEYEQTGEVSFRNRIAARQFLRNVVPWQQVTTDGDIEEAPFTFEPETKAELTSNREKCAGKACRFYDECWANVALKEGGRSNITITNTRLGMEHAKIYAKTNGHAGVLPLGIIPRKAGEEMDDDAVEPDVVETSKPIWAFDEAHNMEEIARAALQREMTRGRFITLQRGIERFTTGHKAIKAARRGQIMMGDQENIDPEQWVRTAETWQEHVDLLDGLVGIAFGQWQERMIQAKESVAKLGDEREIVRPLLEQLDRVRKLLKASTPPWILEDKTDEAMWTKLGKQATELQADLEVIGNPGDPDVTVRYAEMDEDEETGRKTVKLIAAPISVAGKLSSMLWGTYPHVVAVSATLAGPDGLDHWRRRVGAPETAELIAPETFNYQRQSLMYLPSDGKLFDPRGDARLPNTVRGREYLAAYVDRCEQLVLASGGGAFLLFTSNGALNNAYKGAPPVTISGKRGEPDTFLPAIKGLADRLGDTFRLIRQDSYSRKEALELFKEDGNAVLFGVKTFWEGVDVPGDALRLVVANAFPIPPPTDPVWAAMCDAVDREAGEDGAWFRELAIPNATIALKQGVGRLIRNTTDTGVMAVLDGRATILPYGRDIIRTLPPARQTRTLDDVRAFFGKEVR